VVRERKEGWTRDTADDGHTLGIGLYTYHKYRKSIESPVPLDAHGNRIESGLEAGGVRHEYELDSTALLGSGRSSVDDGLQGQVSEGGRVLFTATDDDDERGEGMRAVAGDGSVQDGAARGRR
jgi:solute carrier family 35, member C2